MKWTVLLFVVTLVLTCPPISVGLLKLPSALIFPVTLGALLLAFVVGQFLDNG